MCEIPKSNLYIHYVTFMWFQKQSRFVYCSLEIW